MLAWSREDVTGIAEFSIGLADGQTRWIKSPFDRVSYDGFRDELNPSYGLSLMTLIFVKSCVTRRRRGQLSWTSIRASVRPRRPPRALAVERRSPPAAGR